MAGTWADRHLAEARIVLENECGISDPTLKQSVERLICRYGTRIEELDQERINLEAEITELKADLAKFAGHTAGCASRNLYNHPQLGRRDDCDCGLTEAQERWE